MDVVGNGHVSEAGRVTGCLRSACGLGGNRRATTTSFGHQQSRTTRTRTAGPRTARTGSDAIGRASGQSRRLELKLDTYPQSVHFRCKVTAKLGSNCRFPVGPGSRGWAGLSRNVAQAWCKGAQVLACLMRFRLLSKANKHNKQTRRSSPGSPGLAS